MALEMDLDTYTSPELRDLGSLSQLTADFDVGFHGSIAKLVTLAAVSSPSNPLAPGNGGGTQTPSGNGSVLPNSTSGGAGGGNTTPSSTPTSTPSSTPTSGNAGNTLDNVSQGGSNDPNSGTLGSSDAGGAGAGGGAGSGSLPFTGYAAMLVAGVGAAFAGTGAAMRSRVRRERA